MGRLLIDHSACKLVIVDFPMKKHVAMLHLFVELGRKLVQAPCRVPKSEQAVIGRPVQKAQRRGLLPLFWGQACRRRYDDVERDPGGACWLKAEHNIGLDSTHLISTDEFREAIGSLEVFIQFQVETRYIFIDKLDCLKHLVASVSLQPFIGAIGTHDVHFLWPLSRASHVSNETRRNFASPACRKPCKLIHH